MTQVSFHPGLNFLMLALTAGLATIVIAIVYGKAYGGLGARKWGGLCALRLLAVGVVLMLLFRPVISHRRQLHERRSVTFLIDRSMSMGVADDANGATRLGQALEKLRQWLPRLEPDFDLKLVAFSDTVDSIANDTALMELRPSGNATSLARALEAAALDQPNVDMEAIFLLSDGIHNTGGGRDGRSDSGGSLDPGEPSDPDDPVAIASRLGVSVFTIGLGSALQDRTAYRDVRVTEVQAPDQMSVDHLARVQGYVAASGFPGRVVTAILSEDGAQVAECDVVLDSADGAQEITFEFTPSVKGLHRYTVSVPVLSAEQIHQNNERSTSGLVVDPRIRVLYIEGSLRAEYGALVGRFLAKDPNLEFCALVQTRPDVFMQRSNITGLQFDSIPNDAEVLEQFDVFMLGDLDSRYFRAGQLDRICDRVRNGAGLIMMGGYHSLGPGGFQGTPLEDVLPVFVGGRDVGQVGEPFQPELTRAGRRHPIFANITQFFPSAGPAEIQGLPQLDGCVRVRGPKPGATILCVHPGETAENEVPMPLLAVQPVSKGRAAVFTGDTTRNWHQTLRSLDRETPFIRFWGQTVRWLAGRSDEISTEAGIVATTDKSDYEPGSSITIAAEVRGNDGASASDARVSGNVRGPDGVQTNFEFAAVAGPAGNYRAVFQPPATGRFEFNVTATLDDSVLHSEPLQVEVGRPNLEYDRIDLDAPLLTAIASQSGGRYAHLSAADRLIDALRRQHQARQVQYEIALAWPPLLWVAFVGVLTTEWLLRRKYTLR